MWEIFPKNFTLMKFTLCDGSRNFGSHVSKDRIFRKLHPALPFAQINRFQWDITMRTLEMLLASNKCEKLNSIVWLFEIQAQFLTKVWGFIVVKRVRNWKINKIVFTKFAISHHPDWIRVSFFTNLCTFIRGFL